MQPVQIRNRGVIVSVNQITGTAMSFFDGMFNLQLERAVLGAILLKNDLLDRVIHIIAADDFFDEFHAAVFEQCVAAIQANRIATPMTLRSYFEARVEVGENEKGPVHYLMDLTSHGAVTLTGIADYAKVLRGLSVRRKASVAFNEALERLRLAAPTDDAMKLIEDAEASLFKITEGNKVAHGSVHISDAIEDVLQQTSDALQRGTGLAGISTGFPELDEVCGGLEPGTVTLLCGRPGMGKTQLAMNMGERAALRGDPVLMFQLEMSRQQNASRVLSSQLGIVNARIRKGDMTFDEYADFARRAQVVKKLPIHIDATPALSIEQMHLRARRAVRKHGVKLLIIDYLQLAKAEGFRPGDTVAMLSAISRGTKAMAKDLHVPVLGLCQLKRDTDDAGSSKDKKKKRTPQMSDIKGAGDSEQDADAICILWDADANEDFSEATAVDAHWVKNRFGKKIVVPLAAEFPLSRFISTRGAT